MQTLSKEAEALILDAIRDTVARVAEGNSPTAAVVKVANDRRLPAGFIPLVCQAYNVGRQTQQRESGDGVLGKTAEFDLANTKEALAELYPEVVPTPAEKTAATAIDPAYSKKPIKPQVKLASGGLWDIKAPDAYAHDPNSVFRKAAAEDQRKRNILSDAQLKLAHAKDQFTVKISSLISYFRLGALDRIGWADFSKNASMLFPAEATPLLKHVDGQLGMQKRARREPRDRFETRELFDRTATPYGLLEGCIKAAALVRTEQLELNKLVEPKKTANTIVEPVEVELNVLGLPIEEAPSKEGSFLEFAVGSGVGKGLSDLLSGAASKPTSALVNDKVNELEDPNHDAEMRRIQTQAMITDFLANDDVISGFDPDEVTNAYNEIAQVTPRAATQPALMRPLLRKRLSAGGIEPFEANEIARLEQTLGSTAVQPAGGSQQGVLGGNSVLG